MSPAAPSAAELMRRLDDLVNEVRELRTDLKDSYVRKDVAEMEHHLLGVQINGLETEVHSIGRRFDAMEERAQKAAITRWSIAASSLAGPILVVVILRAMGLVGG